MDRKTTTEKTRQQIFLSKEEVYEAVLHWARARSDIYIPRKATVSLYNMLTRDDSPGVIHWYEGDEENGHG